MFDSFEFMISKMLIFCYRYAQNAIRHRAGFSRSIVIMISVWLIGIHHFKKVVISLEVCTECDPAPSRPSNKCYNVHVFPCMFDLRWNHDFKTVNISEDIMHKMWSDTKTALQKRCTSWCHCTLKIKHIQIYWEMMFVERHTDDGIDRE